MPITFIDRRCSIDVQLTAQGCSFEYGNKTYKRPNEEAVHQFFLKEYQTNKLDTVKLRFENKSYYLHFTLDEPEKCTKRQLRAILAQECNGAWSEEKNGKQRYFVREGWLFSKTRELTHEEFVAYRPTSTIQKTMQLALGALSLVPSLPSHAPQATEMGALLFSVLNAGPAFAQMPAFGEFRINTNTTNDQGYPALAALNDGGFVAVWEGAQTDPLRDIYGQRYNASGAPEETEFLINTNTSSVQQTTTVAALNDGGFVAAWQGLQTGDYNIYGQKYNVSGVPVGSEFRINTNSTSNSHPTVVALKDGDFVVAWGGSLTDTFRDVYGQKYNASGVPAGSAFQINTNTTYTQQTPAIAALNDGGFVVAWQGQQEQYYNIYGQRYDAAGFRVGSEFRINANTTNYHGSPTVAALKDGGFVVAWENYQSGNFDIYGKRYNASGVPLESEFSININTTSNSNPTVAALNDGGFVVAWAGTQTGVDVDIYGQKYNASGVPVGSEFRINTNTTNTQWFPTITALANGDFVVAWESDQTGDFDIYGQRFDANGVPVLNYLPTSPSLTTNSIVTPSLTSNILSTSTATSGSSISSMSSSQSGSSSSIPTPQSSAPTTSAPSVTSPSTSSINTSQVVSSSSSAYSSLSSITSSPSNSQSPNILSITDITYGSEYSIVNSNGESIGTFTITGGTGLYDAAQSNTLTLQLDPDADLVGQTITLFTVPSGQEGTFQSIELEGVSCLNYDTQTVQNGNQYDFQVTVQVTPCATGSKPAATFFPTMLRV